MSDKTCCDFLICLSPRDIDFHWKISSQSQNQKELVDFWKHKKIMGCVRMNVSINPIVQNKLNLSFDSIQILNTGEKNY